MCALEVDGDDVPEFLSNRGGVDSVQDVEAKTMARQGPRKLPAATVVCGWRSWRVGEVVGTDEIFGYRGEERLRTYQGSEDDEASSVAKYSGSRWSEDSEISRRSFACGQRDPVVNHHIDLGQAGTNQSVRGCAMSRDDSWKKEGCSRSPTAAESAGGACR
jgi:hypothetical protein